MGRDPLKGEMRSKDNVTGSGGGDGLPDCPLKWGQSVGKSHPFAIIESDLSSYQKINFLEWWEGLQQLLHPRLSFGRGGKNRTRTFGSEGRC